MIYIVIHTDPHFDTEVTPAAKREDAIDFARVLLHEHARDERDLQEKVLNEHMIKDGWIFYATYGEQSMIRVVERAVI